MTGTKRSGIVYEDSKQSIQRTQKRDTRCGIALLTIQLLPEEETLLKKKRIQLIAVRNESLIPLIADNQPLNNGCKISCRQNKVFLEHDLYGKNVFSGDTIEKNISPIFNESSAVLFGLKSGNTDTITVSKQNKGKLHLFWKSLLTAEETEAVFSENGKDLYLDLKQFLNDKRKPFERAVLMYRLTEQGMVQEQGYVHLREPDLKRFDERILVSDNDNRIICDKNQLIILENEKCYVDYEAKWQFDFSKSSCRADIKDIKINNNKLTAAVHILSLLLPVSSVLILAKNSRTGRITILDEIVNDICTTEQRNNINIDLTEIIDMIGKEETVSLNVGVRYTKGFPEECSLRVSADNAECSEIILKKAIVPEDSDIILYTEKDHSLCITKAD